MIFGDLPREAAAERLRGEGLRLECGPFLLRISSPFEELGTSLLTLYGDHPLVGFDEIVDFDVAVGPRPGLRSWSSRGASAFVDGRRAFRPFPRGQSLPMLEWALNWCCFTYPNQYLILHAAVLERRGAALLLPGPPGSGKSTLCAALSLGGWRLLSDEVAMIRPGTRAIAPVPRPVSLKNESVEAIRRFSSSAVLGPECAGTRKGTVAHMRPPGDAVRRAGEPAYPAWVVFPTFRPGAKALLESLPRGEALMRLAHGAFNYSILGADGFETLVGVVEGCDCFELEFGSLEGGLERLEEIAGAAS